MLFCSHFVKSSGENKDFVFEIVSYDSSMLSEQSSVFCRIQFIKSMCKSHKIKSKT